MAERRESAEASPPWAPPEAGYLSPAEEEQLAALFAALVPRDPERGVPGATDAGAARFVSLLLGRDPGVFEEIAAWRPLYRASLAALESHSRSAAGRSLVELAEAEMAALLSGLERGDLQGLALPAGATQQGLFKTLRRHCLQGCFSDPRWGGNRDRIMWRWLGYLQPPEEVL